jgi:hypothetical protein
VKAFDEKLLRFIAIKLMSPVLTVSMRSETAGVGPTTRPTTPTRLPQGSQGPTGHVVSSDAGKAPGAPARSVDRAGGYQLVYDLNRFSIYCEAQFVEACNRAGFARVKAICEQNSLYLICEK